MTDKTGKPEVTLDPVGRRFVVRDAKGTGELRYQVVGPHIILEHTEVAPALRGRGVAAELARTALEHARANGLTVIPVCPFVIGYLARHPEYRTLVHQPDTGG